jgi:ribosomal protein L37AE/L43A
MSLLRQSDYEQASKKNKIISPRRGSHGGVTTSKKITLPTQHRSPHHNCSQCTRKDARKYNIGPKEVRWLCDVCVIKNKNKDLKEKPNFISARKLWRKDK